NASITSSILGHTYENGRRYHAYHQGEYPLPNDDKEQERLDLLHHIWKLLLGGELYTAPIPKAPERVLDFGTGTGNWAVDFADEFPTTTVIGTDLSPIQPSFVPPNCTFFLEDSEVEWAFGPDDAFDYIHGRAMGGSIRDWKELFEKIYKHLKPGGWVEIQEYETWCQPDDPKDESPPYLMKWLKSINEASEAFGKKLNVAPHFQENMIEAGFVEVEDVVHKVPIGAWSQDPKAKEIGYLQRLHMLDAVEPYSLALYTRSLGWSLEETTELVNHVRSDFANPKHHLYSYFHFVRGRKPETNSSSVLESD
ncbi:methyltransferase, partial [Stipitochalara longipes BDJ]